MDGNKQKSRKKITETKKHEKKSLCEAINTYEGGMVVVTHDARLIEATESQLWVVENNSVTAWDGEFDTYREYLLAKLEAQMESHNRPPGDRGQ